MTDLVLLICSGWQRCSAIAEGLEQTAVLKDVSTLGGVTKDLHHLEDSYEV